MTERYNPIFHKKQVEAKKTVEVKASTASTAKAMCNGVEVEFTSSENLVLPIKKD